jgi:hypothetical protein
MSHDPLDTGHAVAINCDLTAVWCELEAILPESLEGGQKRPLGSRITAEVEVSAVTKRHICEFLKPDQLLSTRRDSIKTIVAYLNTVRLASGESAPSWSERQPADTIEAWSES